MHTNKLIHASSPYLLQHAHNPVDWYEWGEEAFDKARREDKLVLISIGYSACHWCHVMERECFEKEDTAAIMNEHFVCIKVDREERPDVDQVYMDAVQLLTGSGGWPLNCFALPDGRPLHGGTYFPKAEWERTLKSLSEFYLHKKEEALQYATELTNGVKKLSIIPNETSEEVMPLSQVNSILENWKQHFDLELGGFTWAPKFPMPNHYELFLHQATYTGDELMLQEAHTTLTKMAEGGIYDQVGGGFARYATDLYWKVPHFEKMLYDNAQLMGLYANAFLHEPFPLYRKVVKQTHEFLQRELCSPEGAFYSALDADSEGVEGKFYIWTKKELQELLGENEPLYSLYYSVDAYGNWEHGANILYKTRLNRELEQLTRMDLAEIEKVIGACNEILLKARERRVRPGLDDKIITSWNALMVKGYAEAFLVFRDESYLAAAEKTMAFLLGTMWDGKRLYRIYKNGKVSIHGFAEDYGALCEALIKLYEASDKEAYLHLSKSVMEAAIKEFYDEEKGLFYFKSKYEDQLIARKIDLNDDVIPSANSMLAKSLFLLGYLFDVAQYETMALRMMKMVQDKIVKYPTGYSNWMQLILWKHYNLFQVVCVGSESKQAALQLSKKFMPNRIIVTVTQKSDVPLFADKPVTENSRIYICRDKTCGLPLSTAEEAMKQLSVG